MFRVEYRNRVSVMVVLAFLCSCNSVARFQVIPPEEPVSIALSANNIAPVPRIANQAVPSDTGTGFVSGSLLGAVWGVSCGSFFWFCASLGSAAGAMVGGAAGLVVGVMESLPRNEVEALELELKTYLAAQDPNQQLLQAVQQRATGEWLVGNRESNYQLVLGIDGLGLHTYREHRVSLFIRFLSRLEYKDLEGQTHSLQRNFVYESPSFFADSWIEGTSAFIDDQFQSAYQAAAEDVITLYSR